MSHFSFLHSNHKEKYQFLWQISGDLETEIKDGQNKYALFSWTSVPMVMITFNYILTFLSLLFLEYNKMPEFQK